MAKRKTTKKPNSTTESLKQAVQVEMTEATQMMLSIQNIGQRQRTTESLCHELATKCCAQADTIQQLVDRVAKLEAAQNCDTGKCGEPVQFDQIQN